MDHPPPWDPQAEWERADIEWAKVDISPEDLRRFTTRSDLLGLCQTLGFLLIVATTGALSYYAFAQQRWLLMALGLYVHGLVYKHFAEGLHELSHGTVFASKWLNSTATLLYGWLHWPMNPHLYRISHHGYHHRYTLHQGSDGEDVPNYVDITPKLIASLFLKVLSVKALVVNLGRLVSLKPTSHGWRGRGYPLDTWEQFILKNASPKDQRKVRNVARFNLISHLLFAVAAVATGHWFLLILITFAPFYGPGFHGFYCSTHQHAGCDANNPDFRVSCGDAILDPLSSFLYWHMEYHIEHHMFAGIPCYHLRKFSRFAADQLPAKEHAMTRLRTLNKLCPEKFGSWQQWRDDYGRFKGF